MDGLSYYKHALTNKEQKKKYDKGYDRIFKKKDKKSAKIK